MPHAQDHTQRGKNERVTNEHNITSKNPADVAIIFCIELIIALPSYSGWEWRDEKIYTVNSYYTHILTSGRQKKSHSD